MSSASAHTILASELAALVDQVNTQLADDADVKDRLPLDPPEKLFEEVTDGVLLAKLIHKTNPTSLEPARLNLTTKTPHHAAENQNLCIAGAKRLGCSITNIGATDLMRSVQDGTQHLVLGMLWQIVKVGLMNKVTIQKHPELIRLIEPGEDLAVFLEKPPEELLLRWANYHLKRAGCHRVLTNFSSDVKDSEIYAVLLSQIMGADCLLSPAEVVAMEDMSARAIRVLEVADTLGCRKFVTAQDIVNGHQRLNLAFVAHLFNKHPGIQLPSEEELKFLNQSKAELIDTVSRLKATEETHKHQISTLEDQISEATSRLETLTAALSATTDQNSLLAQNCSDLAARNETLDAKITALERELEALSQEQTRATELDKTLSTLQQQQSETEEKMQALDKKLVTKDEQLKKTRVQSAQCLEVMGVEKAKLQQENDLLNQLLEETQSALNSEIEALKARIAELEAENARLRQHILSLEEQLRKAATERDEARLQVAAYVKANERGLQAYNDAKAQAQDSQTMLTALSTQNEMLKADVDGLERQLATARAEMSQMELSLKELRAKYDQEVTDHVQLQRQSKAQLDMISHMSSQVMRNEAQVRHLRHLYNTFQSAKKLALSLFQDCSYERFVLMSGADAPLVDTLIRPASHLHKEAKPVRYVLKDNFLLAYKIDKSEPQEVIRVDDAIVRKGDTDSYFITVSSVHSDAQVYQLQCGSQPQQEAWYNALVVASEWWADNKQKRMRAFTASPRGSVPSGLTRQTSAQGGLMRQASVPLDLAAGPVEPPA
eukprot:m.201090 g.201090  ORF g.201090 m.201090 type:complete len:779 (-) comp21929_c0_seq1:19-2355(-)